MAKTVTASAAARESEQPLIDEAVAGEMELTEGNLVDLWNDIMYG